MLSTEPSKAQLDHLLAQITWDFSSEIKDSTLAISKGRMSILVRLFVHHPLLKFNSHLRFQRSFKRLDILNIFKWCRRYQSCLGQGTTALQRSLKTKHFLEPPNPSRDCLVLPIVLPPLGRSPWPPSVIYRSGWTWWGVEGVE